MRPTSFRRRSSPRRSGGQSSLRNRGGRCSSGCAGLTNPTFFTEFRPFLGTPLYMSPEQAESDALAGVDTRSDDYALGVLLHELLTGGTRLWNRPTWRRT